MPGEAPGAIASGQVSPDDVRQALEQLYDNVALARTRLASQLPEVAAMASLPERAQALRRLLLGAIELLQPARPGPFGSRAARSYEVLSLRYVEGMSIVQVADELSLVERQVYRDLRRAYSDLAQMLTARLPRPPAATPAVPPPGEASGQLQAELERLTSNPRRLDLGLVIKAAIAATSPLAARLGATVVPAVAANLAAVSADEGLLRQLLIQMLSLALQNDPGRRANISAAQDGGKIVVSLSYNTPLNPQPGYEERLASLQRLAETQHLGWHLSSSEGTTCLSLSLSAAQPRPVLVIEDNEGAIELYRRYLGQGQDWQVIGAADPRLSYDMAVRLQPAVILLDVMMPRQDGWSILQLLRSQPQTAQIPIIICSVFDDPELASALGANAYLKKPVSQFELLAALKRVAG